VLVIKNIS